MRARTNRWKRSLATGVLGAALVAGGAGIAAARPHGGHCGGQGGFPLERIERGVARLDLPEDKRVAIYAAIDQARAQRRGLDGQISDAHERMRELLEQDAPSLDAVTAQADAIGALMTEMRKIELRALVEVRSLVGAEQWKQLEKRRPREGRRPGSEP